MNNTTETTTTRKHPMNAENLRHLTYLYQILSEAKGTVQVDAAIDAIAAFKAEVAR